MTPGEMPPLPTKGTAQEFANVYLGTVGLYKQCEMRNKTLSDFIRGL